MNRPFPRETDLCVPVRVDLDRRGRSPRFPATHPAATGRVAVPPVSARDAKPFEGEIVVPRDPVQTVAIARTAVEPVVVRRQAAYASKLPMMVLNASHRRNAPASNRASSRARQPAASARGALSAAIASSMSVQSSCAAFVFFGNESGRSGASGRRLPAACTGSPRRFRTARRASGCRAPRRACKDRDRPPPRRDRSNPHERRSGRGHARVSQQIAHDLRAKEGRIHGVVGEVQIGKPEERLVTDVWKAILELVEVEPERQP